MYKFILGGPGSGKSNKVFADCISAATADDSSHFLLVTPEQSTTWAEKEIIKRHPSHATDNIDVVSFSRLAYRVFGELGIENPQVINDIEKAMILRRIGAAHKQELRIWGNRFDKPGFVDNLKSMISELYQYGLAPEDIKPDEAFGSRLNNKLIDLRLIYSEFKKEIAEKYTTAEEIPDILSRNIHRSNIVRNSVIILDGFTGFTPIQYRIIEGFLCYAREVVVTVSIGEDSDNQLFAMSRDMIRNITVLGDKNSIRRGRDEILTTDSFIERHILRYDGAVYHGGAHAPAEIPATDVLPATAETAKTDGLPATTETTKIDVLPATAETAKIDVLLAADRKNTCGQSVETNDGNHEMWLQPRIVRAQNMKEEAGFICSSIESLVKKENLRYREIAVVCSDQEAYGSLIAHQMEVSGIPSYMDETIGIGDNALVMMITAALDVIHSDYSYESFVRYLKSGLPEEDEDKVFILDNYIYECGRRGYKRMTGDWDYVPADLKKVGREKINEYKNAALDKLEGLHRLLASKKALVPDIVDAITELMDKCDAAGKLDAMREEFAKEKDRYREREYSKAYESVVNILADMKDLLKDDLMDAEEFCQIFTAGIGQVKLGVLPSGADRVVIGDITRSRIEGVKVLFVAGANEGLLPRLLNRRNVITDLEKEKMKDAGYELAPTAKEDLLIQRYYIYRIFSKPTRQLIISYVGIDANGSAMRPSYITVHLLKLFPSVKVEEAAGHMDILNVNAAICFIGDKLRELRINGIENADAEKLNAEVSDGKEPDSEKPDSEKPDSVKPDAEFETLYAYLREKEKKRISLITDAALLYYKPEKLSKESIALLYGDVLFGSVSKLETFAKCPYQFFAKYGLGLKEIEEFTFRAVDIGNIAHSALEKIFAKAHKKEIDLRSLSEADKDTLVGESISEAILDDESSKYKDSARNEYIVKRVQRVVTRSLWGLLENLNDSYYPYEMEWAFTPADHLGAASIALDGGRTMELSGKIDRTDIDDSDPGKIGVRIIDYKSGKKSWDLNDIINGNDLQITMYMAAVSELLAHRFDGRDISPEQMYYYTVHDPIVDKDELGEGKTVEEELRRKMTLSGVMSSEDIKRLIPYVRGKAEGIGKRIVGGDNSIAPKYSDEKHSSCNYCDYRSLCGFDKKIEGFSMKADKKYKKDEQWQIIDGH